MNDNEQYLQEFVDEAAGHAETVETLLVDPAGQNQPEQLNEVFRAVHSIKGMAGFFGLSHIVDLAHAMENVFAAIRDGKLRPDEAMTDRLLAANDCLKHMIENVGESEAADIAPHMQALRGLLNGPSAPASPAAWPAQVKAAAPSPASEDPAGGNLYRLTLRFHHDLQKYPDGMDGLLHAAAKAGKIRSAHTDHAPIGSFDDVLAVMDGAEKDAVLTLSVASGLEPAEFARAMGVEPAAVAVQKSSAPAAGAPAAKHASIRVEDTIRVNVKLLNDLMDMASEMVLGRNQLLRRLSDRRDSIPGLSPILQNIDRLTSSLQEKIMQTRMQPVANVFNKFPRIIRDMGRELQKEIRLRIEGADVELDKSMIEAIGDPITHLVRNAADHGLESPAAREKAGKDRVGTITLRAYHEGGFVHVEVADDGAGLQLERIRHKALETGIVTREELAGMSEHEIVNLIFRPGFSTADRVTDISGRGVGMDVVQTNIRRIGGSVDIRSTAGRGTTVRLVLPLTLAIIQSFLVEAGGCVFALPQVNIREIVQARPDSAQRIEHIDGADVLRLRGRLIPVVYLHRVLGMPETPADGGAGGAPVVILLRVGAITFGVAVHTIIESEETLAKPLPRALKSCACYSGVTILGDGRTAMILDPEGIIRTAGLSERGKPETAAEAAPENGASAEKQNLLLFRCTGDEIFALDMSMIARVEEVSSDRIEHVGKMEFLRYRENTLRIIRPEDYLPVGRKDGGGRLYVIVPKLVAHPIGILVTRILDNVHTEVRLDTDTIRAPGILGSTVCDGRMVLLVQLYELFSLADPAHYPPKAPRGSRHLRVLVAEDTVFFRKTIQGYLEQAGYEVDTVPDGQAAWNRLNHGKYDLVVSDIQMPVMDGWELARRIREKPAFEELPVIALTSLTGQVNEKRGRESGFDAYEHKLDRDHLLRTIAAAFEKKYGGKTAC